MGPPPPVHVTELKAPQMARKKITARTGERLVRLAFELEDLANRLRDEGHKEAESEVRRASNRMGNVGRDLLDKFSVGPLGPVGGKSMYCPFSGEAVEG